MERRLRVAHVLVQPVLIWDDGQELTEGPTLNALMLPPSKLAEFADGLPAQVEAITAQMTEETDAKTVD